MSNDSQLTVNFLRLEKQLAPLIKQNQLLLQRVNELEKRLNGVAECGVAMYLPQVSYGQNLRNFKLDTLELSLPGGVPGAFLDNVKSFYKLQKLRIPNEAIQSTSLKTANLSSDTLEHLILQSCNNPFTSLEGIDQLPNLKKLELQDCQHLQPFADILRSYSHEIEEIIVARCPGVNQVALATYCTQNNIRLTIS